MQTISTTELRTKSTELINTLLAGEDVDLIHRSKIVAEIRPKKYEVKIFNAKKVLEFAKKMNLPKLSYKEREQRYRKHLKEKYDHHLS